MVGEPGSRHAALRAGAAGFVARPLDREGLEAAFAGLEETLDRPTKRLLHVEDDEHLRESVAELVGGEDVEVVGAGSAAEALAELEQRGADCLVLDLKLPDGDGFELLEKLQADERFREIPVIIHTGKALTRKEETRLKRYAGAIVL